MSLRGELLEWLPKCYNPNLHILRAGGSKMIEMGDHQSSVVASEIPLIPIDLQVSLLSVNYTQK